MTHFGLHLASKDGITNPADLSAVDETKPTHVILLGEEHEHLSLRRAAAILNDRGFPTTWRALPQGRPALIAMATNALTAQLNPGAAVAYLENLSEVTWSGVWSPAVTKLTKPDPNLIQHLLSWWPWGRGFLGELTPERRVVTVRKEFSKTQILNAEPVVPRNDLLIKTSELSEEAMKVALSAAQAQRIVPYPEIFGDPLPRYGNKNAVEMFALPADLSYFLPGAAAFTCSTCGAEVFTTTCYFCRVSELSQTSNAYQGAMQ